MRSMPLSPILPCNRSSGSLTGLANRAAFMERLRLVFARTKHGAKPFAVLYLDLDHLATVVIEQWRNQYNTIRPHILELSAASTPNIHSPIASPGSQLHDAIVSIPLVQNIHQVTVFILDLNRSTTKSQSVSRIAAIVQNDAMILPHGANLARMEFSERTGAFSAFLDPGAPRSHWRLVGTNN
jgi:hypothetical protein